MSVLSKRDSHVSASAKISSYEMVSGKKNHMTKAETPKTS